MPPPRAGKRQDGGMARPWTPTDLLRAAVGHPTPDDIDRRTIPQRLRPTDPQEPDDQTADVVLRRAIT